MRLSTWLDASDPSLVPPGGDEGQVGLGDPEGDGQSPWAHTHISSSRCLQRARDSTNCTPPAGQMPFAERLWREGGRHQTLGPPISSTTTPSPGALRDSVPTAHPPSPVGQKGPERGRGWAARGPKVSKAGR